MIRAKLFHIQVDFKFNFILIYFVFLVVWKTDAQSLRIIQEDSTRITYEAAFLIPTTHWLGFFIQFSFPGFDNTVLQITTESNFVPDYYPFADCTGADCLGKLV